MRCKPATPVVCNVSDWNEAKQRQGRWGSIQSVLVEIGSGERERREMGDMEREEGGRDGRERERGGRDGERGGRDGERERREREKERQRREREGEREEGGRYTHTLTLTHTHSHTHTLTHSLTPTHTLAHSLTPTHTHSLTHTHSHSLTLRRAWRMAPDMVTKKNQQSGERREWENRQGKVSFVCRVITRVLFMGNLANFAQAKTDTFK